MRLQTLINHSQSPRWGIDSEGARDQRGRRPGKSCSPFRWGIDPEGSKAATPASAGRCRPRAGRICVAAPAPRAGAGRARPTPIRRRSHRRDRRGVSADCVCADSILSRHVVECLTGSRATSMPTRQFACLVLPSLTTQYSARRSSEPIEEGVRNAANRVSSASLLLGSARP